MDATRWATAAVSVVALGLVAVGCGGDQVGAPVSAGGAPSTTAVRTDGGTARPSNQPNPKNTAVPSTSDQGSTPTTAAAAEGDDAEDAYVAALVEQGRLEGADEDQRRCVAEHQVQAIGVDQLRAAGITPASIGDGSKDLTDLSIDRPLAEAIVDGYPACGYDMKPRMVAGMAGIAHGSAEVTACLEETITDEVAREYAVLAIISDSADPDGQFEAFVTDELGACFGPR
jgi:hypothetical protein